eukprot:s9246_g2.t1
MKKISTVTVRTGVMLRDFWRAWGPVRAYLACDDLLCFAVGVQKPCWRSMGDITFDACIAMWEEVAYLRRAARKLKLLVDNEKTSKARIVPSLPNIKLNKQLLRPLTMEMGRQGRISKPIDASKDAFAAFYKSQIGEEEDCNAESRETQIKVTRAAAGSAFFVKQMLTVKKANGVCGNYPGCLRIGRSASCKLWLCTQYHHRRSHRRHKRQHQHQHP